MPLFMDVHQKAPEGAKAKDVAAAHEADVKTQGKYGVQYLRYWFDREESQDLLPRGRAERGSRKTRPPRGARP